ncbi:hypothetical protein RND71_027907 [Anisodus tanguticus]|uniref:Uncharacterized protein n=1 Tax=Anisodus tanguticus TaxID=243964 RepID=A0AAE1V8N3_9SOLA|nr:hypothetical protein RND71_027907 [Anisodus tanguticus]
MEGNDSDLLSYIDLVNEYNDSLGYVDVQQLIVSVPCGKYYEIECDNGIRTLLSFVNDQFDVINLFAVEDTELSVCVENIEVHKESVIDVDDAATDCNSDSDSASEDESDCSDYDSEELEALAKLKSRVINEKLSDYMELNKFMTFKDIPKARTYLNLYSLCNGYSLQLKKSDTIRIRYVCVYVHLNSNF